MNSTTQSVTSGLVVAGGASLSQLPSPCLAPLAPLAAAVPRLQIATHKIIITAYHHLCFTPEEVGKKINVYRIVDIYYSFSNIFTI